MQTELPVLKNAQEFIEVIRQGKEPRGVADMQKSLHNLMIGNRPDPKAMEALGEELATGTRQIRIEIIDLLDRIRNLADPGYELRTPEVIALLVGPAFAQTDSARGLAMEMLYKYASTTTLSHYRDVFMRALKERPDGYILTLIAKAKTPEAREEVDRLSRLPVWNEPGSSRYETMRIARAALGDTKIENEYLAELPREEKAGSGGARDALFPLAQIGTRRSLQEICLRMRSPLIIDDGIRQKSIRLFVMDALRYAFPERPELDSGNVRKEEDYIKVEQFCTQELGVDFRGRPRPDFFVEILYRSR